MVNGRHGHSEDRNPSFGICNGQIASGLTPLKVYKGVPAIHRIMLDDGEVLAEIPLLCG